MRTNPLLCTVLAFGVATSLSAGLQAADDSASAAAAVEQAPIDWDAKVATLRALYKAAQDEGTEVTQELYTEMLREASGEIDVSQLTLDDFGRHWMMIGATPERAEAGKARLASMSTADTVAGAKAAMLLAQVSRASDQDGVNARLALDHPQLMAMLMEGSGREYGQAVALIGQVEESARPAYAAKALRWADGFTPSTPPMKMRAAAAYCRGMRDLGEIVPKEDFNTMRMGLVRTATTMAAETDDPKQKKSLERLATQLDSAAMRGELIDHPAPALTFNWVQDPNGSPTWKSLDDLKGKIVVLDFWATWCGPCVASFPQVRDLRAHYPAEDVVILGVTSLQGAHYPKGADKVDTTDKPELEKELMAGYMGDMEMTWAVAFSDQEVFNPEYDVNGIPHVAIIDANGVLRHNGLHPAAEPAKKLEIIDGLLREAGKTPPASGSATSTN